MKNMKHISEVLMDKDYEGFTDLTLIAFLVYQDFEVSHINRHERKQGEAVFYFKRTLELEATVRVFLSNRGAVEPKKFNNVIRDLKSRITNEII
jgi:hypothetical protein